MSLRVHTYCDFHGCGKEFDPREGGEIQIRLGLSQPRALNFCKEHFEFIGGIFETILKGNKKDEDNKAEADSTGGGDSGPTDGAPANDSKITVPNDHEDWREGPQGGGKPLDGTNILSFPGGGKTED